MKKTAKKTVDTPVYKLCIKMNQTEYVTSGDSLEDAFAKLGLTFQQVKTKGEIIVERGERKHTRVIQLQKLRRYFLSKILLSGLIRDFNKLLA